jgi:hypothetical protein
VSGEGEAERVAAAKFEAIGDAMDAIERSIFDLLKGADPARRKTSLLLMQASMAVALHGEDAVTKQVVDRIASWDNGRKRKYEQATADATTRRTVMHAKETKVRDPGSGESAFEIAAKAQGISRYTAEKRRYRKRRN